jgi:hypothetical protein
MAERASAGARGTVDGDFARNFFWCGGWNRARDTGWSSNLRFRTGGRGRLEKKGQVASRCFFFIISRQAIRRGVVTSVEDRVRAIQACIGARKQRCEVHLDRDADTLLTNHPCQEPQH